MCRNDGSMSTVMVKYWLCSYWEVIITVVGGTAWDEEMLTVGHFDVEISGGCVGTRILGYYLRRY